MPARTCVITGGSRGIGLATALRFARTGANLVISARNADGLRAAARQIEAAGGACETVAADVGQPGGAASVIAAAERRFGRVDVLVNNAGSAPLTPVETMSIEQYRAAIAINIDGVFHTCRAAWPLMKRQGGGWIVNVSSRSSVDPFPGFAVYGGCKAWVNTFSQALANEGKPHRIRVHVVAPGGVETGMFRELFPDVPAEKILAPDDVAATIEALCDERMDHSVGQPIFVVK